MTVSQDKMQQQVAQAIQPMLDEFRQRMERVTQELSDQMTATPLHDAGTADPGQEAPHRQEAPEAGPQPSEGKQAPEPAPKPPPTQNQPDQPARDRPLLGALPSAVQMVGHSGAQWLQSLLVAGLGALLAESAHANVQQRAEQGLHTLLQKAFEAAPADFANQEMLEKAERTLQLILREALDAIFAEGVRTAVQQTGKQTLQQSLHGDFGSALKNVEETLQFMLTALIAVLRRHQQTILRLLLALLLLALGHSLEQPEKAT